MTHKAKPVDAFGPEIMQALIEGSKRRIEIKMPIRKAVLFRQRTNQLRHAMRASNHPMVPVVSQTKVSILWGEAAGLTPVEEKKSRTNVRWPKDPNVEVKLVISPADSEFTDMLTKAGVTLKPLTQDPVADIASTDAPTMEDVLANYVGRDGDE